jgi:hypothetical protein
MKEDPYLLLIKAKRGLLIQKGSFPSTYLRIAEKEAENSL